MLWNTRANLTRIATNGDRFVVRGGTYYGTNQNGSMTNQIFGTPLLNYGIFLSSSDSNNPIVVQNYPGETPLLDGPLLMSGNSNVWFIGLEIFLSDAPMPLNLTRDQQNDAAQAGVYRKTLLDIGSGLNLKFINCVFRNGYASTAPGGEGTEIYGCLFLASGRHSSDLSSGHGCYTSGGDGKRFVDNILMNNFLNGLNLYNLSDVNAINSYTIEGNIVAGNGYGYPSGEQMLVSASGATNLVVSNNFFYTKPVTAGTSGASMVLGYGSSPLVRNATISNYFLHAAPAIYSNTLGTFKYNKVYCDGAVISMWGDWSGITLDYNDYQSSFWPPFNPVQTNYFDTFDQWKARTGGESHSTFATNPPTTGVQVFVRTNQYEAKRGHVVILNWATNDNVTVDISALGFNSGDRYKVRAAQAWTNAIITRTYDGNPISLPMTNWAVIQPSSLVLASSDPVWVANHTGPDFGGDPQTNCPSMFPLFGVFVVTEDPSPPPTAIGGVGRVLRPSLEK